MKNINMSTENHSQTKAIALELFNVQLAIDDQAILQALTFDLEEGEILCLLGPSGCGKTTALKTIAGLTAPQQGQINLFGDTVFSDTKIPNPSLSLVTRLEGEDREGAKPRFVGAKTRPFVCSPPPS